MSKQSIREYFKVIYERYHKASKALRHLILNELCANTGYNRKYAIRKLNVLPPGRPSCSRRRQRNYTYGSRVLSVLTAVRSAAGYPGDNH
jgi:hypothetical protein